MTPLFIWVKKFVALKVAPSFCMGKRHTTSTITHIIRKEVYYTVKIAVDFYFKYDSADKFNHIIIQQSKTSL